MAGSPIKREQMVPPPPPSNTSGSGSGDMVAANHLSEITDDAAARANLGLGTLATQSGTFSGSHSGTSTGNNTGDQFTAMTASRILGRVTAGFGPAEQLSGAQVQAMLDLSGYALASSLSSYLLTANFTWANLSGKPTSFTPIAHSHAISDVTGLQSALDGKQASGAYLLTSNFTWANLSGKPATFAPSAHSHVIADVTGLQSALDGKQASGTYATGSGSATGSNTGDETKATIDTKIGATGGSEFYRKDGTWAAPSGGSGGSLATLYTLTAAHSNSTVTPTTISNAAGANPWTHTLVAGKVYRFTIFADYQSVALTTGGRMNLLGAGGLAGGVKGMMWGGIVQAAANSTLEVPIYSFANGAGAFLLTPSVSPINAPHIWGADFVFVCTMGGTLSLQWASEAAGSAAQLNANSVMMVEQLN